METNKISHLHIEKYLSGNLDEKAMHELERQALDDPFLADAIEGYAHAESSSDSHLSLLQKQLYHRIAHQQEKKNEIHFTWQRISVAAAASLMFISASILFWMKGSQSEQQRFNSEKKVDVILASPKDVRHSGHLKPEISSNGQIVGITASSGAYSHPGSEPLVGWPEYHKYLQENLVTLSASDKIVIRFDVNKQGDLENLDMAGELNPAVRSQVLDIIKEGPKWKPSSFSSKIEIKLKE